jgi:hypothetical protein
MGLIAGGKSTLARGLANKFSLPYFNTDVVRKELAGKAPESRQGSSLNQGIYSPEFTRMTYDALLDHASRELSRNQSVVLDGSYHKRSERERVAQCAAECGASLFFILCQCDEEETARRLAMRARNPQAVSDGTWEIFQRQKESFEFPDELPGHSLMIFDTKGSSPQLLQKLFSILSESHAV